MNKIIQRMTLLILVITTLLSAQTSTAPALGEGTTNNPYQIATLENLYWLSQNSSEWSKGFIQTANIDASSTSGWDSNHGWSPIGDNTTIRFTGKYDGQDYSISGLYMNRFESYQGFFGSISGATIMNITLENVNIFGNDFLGGLIGSATSATGSTTISNCKVSGVAVIAGRTSVGGLVGLSDGVIFNNCSASIPISASSLYSGGMIGRITNGTQISECFATGNVNGYTYTGGLIGTTDGVLNSISKSYATGNVNGGAGSQVGGFIGTNSSSTITNCYSSGRVDGTGSLVNGFIGYNASSSSSNSFWNITTSGKTDGGLLVVAEGKTTLEMQTQSTFTNATWDFSNCWEIIDSGFPTLINNSYTPLPVELTIFTAKEIKKNINLNWTTATEVNNYGFEIQKSTINAKWENVGFIEGHGNSNSPKYYSYIDQDIFGSSKFSYRLKQVDIDGSFEYSEIVEVTLSSPSDFKLTQNYPNPFNPNTTINYSIPKDGFVTLNIYDILGNEVVQLENTKKVAGNYSTSFEASNLTSGLYFYTLRLGNFIATKKMMLVK